MSGASKLDIEKVSKKFETASHTLLALENISMKITEGEFLCLLGPSGCGKSTILNLIAGLEFPDEGKILVDGNPVAGPGSDRMVLFQESALFPWLNVIDNVLFGLKLKPGLTNSERKEKAVQFLRMVGLEKFMHVNVHQLSGGMKQRVALARALAPDPKILLMDEPFAALDAMTREQFYTDIQQIWHEEKKTIIFVTHNVAEAVCLGDRILVMTPNPGKIEKEITIALPRPRDIRDLEVARIANDITHILRQTTHNEKVHE